MKLEVSEKVFEKFPKLHVGVVIAKGIDNAGTDKEIYHLLEEIEKLVRLSFVATDLAVHPMIAPWRVAYAEFGAKPTRFHSSVEALMRRILKGEPIPKVNKAVDLCNYISLKHLVPAGVNDLDKIDGYVHLTYAKGNEKFTPLGTNERENPERGEIVYRDKKEVICRRWNWRDSEKTKVTEKTKNVIYYVDGLPPITKEKVSAVLDDISSMVKTFCKGEAEQYIVNKENPMIEF